MLVSVLLSLGSVHLVAASLLETRLSVAATACSAIAKAIGLSKVFHSGSAQYANDIHHWMPSASLAAACTVEPATLADLSLVMKILSKSTTSFAVKSGGHSPNPGASGSKGVVISTTKFDAVSCDKKAMTCEFGPGQTASELYEKLDAYGMMVLGPRIGIVGIAGFVLGGGYSWLTNKHGLAIDSVLGYEIVLSSGRVLNVNANENPDLLFGLKGGLNNFGVVTKFTTRAFHQGMVYGGLVNYNSSAEKAFTTATVNFAANNKDVNACVISSYISTQGRSEYAVLTFYNGPKAPKGTFDQFFAIPATTNDVKTRSYADLVNSVSPAFSNSAGQRGLVTSGGVQILDAPNINKVSQLIKYYGHGAGSGGRKGSSVSSAVEPFIASSVIRSNISATAFPHKSFWSPLAFNTFWDLATDDDTGFAAAAAIANDITSFAVSRGSPGTALSYYPNYSGFQVSLKQMYGDNLARLKAIAAVYDPEKVMKRAGGFSFQ